MNGRFKPSIEADLLLIAPCERRLALSASVAGELLLEALNVSPNDDTQPHDIAPPVPQSLSNPAGDQAAPTINAGIPDLVQQAAELRQTRGLDGSGQTVAVIDSGVAWDHVSLGSGYGPGYRVVGGWDFAENDADPYDDGPAGYHGTHVAGLLVGDADAYSGVAPASDIVALRVFDDSGAGQLQWIEQALQWVHANQDSFESPITTINLSVGAALNDANRGEAMLMLEDELQLLREDNILVFAASGNLFQSTGMEQGLLYPASSPAVVAVASVGDSGDLSGFAQRDDGVFAAQGESIRSAVPDHVFGWDGNVDDVARLDGTSMATPQVAAASMLIRQSMIESGTEPTADAVLERLRQAAIEKVDPVTGSTYHTVDLTAAIGDAEHQHTATEQTANVITRYQGSSDNDKLELDLTDGIQLRVGGLSYRLDAQTSDQPLVIDVGGGNDSLRIQGSDLAERLIVRSPNGPQGLDAVSSISTHEFTIQLRGFENVSFHGGGGSDRATMFDSAGSDSLDSHPGRATLKGVGYQFDVIDVSRIYVHATSGGNDTAFLHDSEGDDKLAVRPQFTSLRNAGTFQLAYGFERVYAYATAGGFDRAVLYDSVGDDTMSISSGRSMIAGPGYYASARGFESTEGQAIAGGNDLARIYADQSSSHWNATDDRLQWTGQHGAVRIARGFERSMAFQQYEPIGLMPQQNDDPWKQWLAREADERSRMETDASRAVFDALGK